MRRTIARRLVESKQTVPHFYLSTDIDIQRMLELRQRVNDSGSIKISVNDFVVKAYAQALMAFPAANAAWAEDRIFRFARADIGVAVRSEEHTSELQSLMRTSYAVFFLKKKKH